MSAVLRLNRVTRVHGRGVQAVQALRGVTMEVYAGELVAVMGPSGSGKSTLLTLAGGLDQPTEGHVLVEGQDLAGLGNQGVARLRRTSVGYVFQDFNLIPALTAVENVALPLELDGTAARTARKAARAALAEVGLDELAGRFPDEMSGGQQQRVAIARAVVGERRLVLADEPTGALDTVAGARVLDLMEAVRERRGTTMLVVSYDPAVAERAGRELHLTDGRLTAPARTAPASRPGPGG